MEEDDSESISRADKPSNNEIPSPEKTCAEPMDGDTFNLPTVSVDFNQSTESTIENNVHDRNDSSLKSSANPKPSTSGRSKRRSGAKKHRAGRNRKRKWKPYHKLTVEERMKLDTRKARRSRRMRGDLSGVGFPLAPFNTNQFLINDYLSCHVIKTPDYEEVAHELNEMNHDYSDDSSEEHYHINYDPGEFDQQSFLEDYELVHEEYLNSLTQHELAEEFLNLEDKIEALDKQLKELQEQREHVEIDIDAHNPLAEIEKIEVFRSEIEKLFQENQDLETQNEKLRKLLGVNSGESEHL